MVYALPAQWDILKQDLRYTVRTLNRARGFALTAIGHRAWRGRQHRRLFGRGLRAVRGESDVGVESRVGARLLNTTA